LIDVGQYLLTCYWDIGMNPVRANRVNHPDHYRWSGYHCHATERSASIVEDHEVFLRIASTPEERMYRYRALFCKGLDTKDAHDMRKAVTFSVPLRNNLFKERIEATLGKSVGYIARGKPKQG
jgi:putative transposase